MSIYTGKGDDGSTGLLYGGRVSKSDLATEAFGTVDEAVAALGVARAEVLGSDPFLAEELLRLQRSLFVVAAELATAPKNRNKLEPGTSLITSEMVAGLEADLDRVIAERGSPREFLVPGGNRTAALLDLSRTVIRRAERRAVASLSTTNSARSLVVPYLNRLSDYLYILARAAEDDWTPSRDRGNE